MFPFKRRPQREGSGAEPGAESPRTEGRVRQDEAEALTGNATPPETKAPPSESPAARAAFALAERREHSLVSLIELLNALNVSMDLYEIADIVLFNLMGHFGCSRAAVWLLPRDPSEDVVLVRCHGISRRMAQTVGAVWSRWLTNHLGQIREPILLRSIVDIVGAAELKLAEDNDLALFAPVFSQGEFLGFVALGRRVAGEEYRTRELDVLQASLNLLGVGFENTRQYNRAVESNRQLRETNEKLREVDELKSEFLRNTNHEVRTPLCIINGYLDMLHGNADLPPTCREHVDVLRQQVASLQGMLMNLIDYSKLMVDDLEVNVRHGDPVSALKSYYESRRPGIAVELREFKFSAASQLPGALCDPERVVQIVEALVENAVKYTPQGSHIHLRVDSEERDGTTWLAVRVEDDGPGIPAERLNRIFESFVQGDGSVTREVGGMGLGLSLARSLAEKMGGRLEVTSEIGRGTTFTLLLPTG